MPSGVFGVTPSISLVWYRLQHNPRSTVEITPKWNLHGGFKTISPTSMDWTINYYFGLGYNAIRDVALQHEHAKSEQLVSAYAFECDADLSNKRAHLYKMRQITPAFCHTYEASISQTLMRGTRIHKPSQRHLYQEVTVTQRHLVATGRTYFIRTESRTSSEKRMPN